MQGKTASGRHCKSKRPRLSRPFKTEVKTAPRDNISIVSPPEGVKLLLLGAILAFRPQQNLRSNTLKRGPDGIRTRICYRREVPCCRYTTGPIAL